MLLRLRQAETAAVRGGTPRAEATRRPLGEMGRRGRMGIRGLEGFIDRKRGWMLRMRTSAVRGGVDAAWGHAAYNGRR